MRYFSGLANQSKDYTKSREEVFKQICVARLKGEEKGVIKLDDKILEDIAVDILNTYKSKDQDEWRIQNVKKISNYKAHQKPYVSFAYEIAATKARDFFKIEEFITNNINDTENDLISAFKGKENERIFVDQAGRIFEVDKGFVQYGEDAGYVILNIDAVGVHAEVKIIEYLILTGIISDLEEGARIYVGISKLCCKGCDVFIKAANKVFGLDVEIFYSRGSHGLQPEWVQPIICCDDYPNVIGYYWNVKKQQYEEAISEKQEGFIKCIHLVAPNQRMELNEAAPALPSKSLKEGSNVYQTVYSWSSTGSQSPSIYDEEIKIEPKNLTTNQLLQTLQDRYADPRVDVLIFELKEKLKEFEAKEEVTISADLIYTTWYDFLTIKNSLIKKGISNKHILSSVETSDELDDRLDEIKEENSFYIIPLNINAIDGSFAATNHWAGLYVQTDEDGKITTIKYLNPIGQEINQELNFAVLEKTGVPPEDLTMGKGVQFAYIPKSGIELKGNINDCGPLLVQLLWELVTYKEILTNSLSEKDSTAFGQHCRKEQRWDEEDPLALLIKEQNDKLFLQKVFLINQSCNETLGCNLYEAENWFSNLLNYFPSISEQIDAAGIDSGFHANTK